MVGYLSPFAKEAKKEYRDFEPRGKADDISVIIAQIHTKNEGKYDYDDYKSIPYLDQEV